MHNLSVLKIVLTNIVTDCPETESLCSFVSFLPYLKGLAAVPVLAHDNLLKMEDVVDGDVDPIPAGLRGRGKEA